MPVLRPLLTILIGVVLSLLMALAALFIVIPIVGKGGQGLAQAIAVVVFCAMLIVVVRSVLRASHSADR